MQQHTTGTTTVGGGYDGSSASAVAMASISPISTLERQYHSHVVVVSNGSNVAAISPQRLLFAIHCNTACCVPLQDVWKFQGGGGVAPPTTTTSTSTTLTADDDATISTENDTASTTAIATTQPHDDPFSFLNTGTTPLSGKPPIIMQPEMMETRKKPNLGRFLKKVAATTTKSIERGMHHLAVKADQGRTPDLLIVGLFDSNDPNHTILLSATEAEPLPDNKVDGIRFRIPLIIPSHCNSNVTIKLFVRSGAALASSKHYMLAESTPISVIKLREALVQQQQQPPPSRGDGVGALAQPSLLFFPVPLNSPFVLGGQLSCIVTTDRKFPILTGRGWSLQDPNPATAYNSDMFHLPLDQSYLFSMPNRPITTASLLATERTVESAIVLPIATAFAQLAANACRRSLQHCMAVRNDVYWYRHDVAGTAGESGQAYADISMRISHLQTNTTSSSFLQEQCSKHQLITVSAMFQRPNSIFEVEVLSMTKLPLHPMAAGGFRPEISCRWYPKPIRTGILPAVLQAQPGGKLPSSGYLLGNARIQITLPKQGSTLGGSNQHSVAVENPFDPTPTAPALDETWECVIPLELLFNRNSGEHKEYPVYAMSGQCMGSIVVSFVVQMIQQEQPTPQSLSPTATSLAQGGLVSMVGLTNVMDGILPALDFDDAITSSFANSLSAERLRRRSQLATMGHFILYAYLDQHNQFVRQQDCEILEERAMQYKKALDAAYAPRSTSDAFVPSYRDRTPRPFRPSASRNTMLLSGIGFNVHTASLSLDVLEPSQPQHLPNVEPAGAVLHNITCGAPADHARGFGNVFANKDKASTPTTTVGLKSPLGPVVGGLRRLEAARRALAEDISNQQTILIMSIANYFVDQRQKFNGSPGAGGVVRPVTHVPAGNEVLHGMRCKIFEAVQCLHHLTWTCAVRRASVFSQALGIAVSSYLSCISDSMKQQSSWPELWSRHGFLVSFEGLLSAAGKELGMIEDASVGIDMLRMVRIILVPDDGAVNVSPRTPVPHSHYIRWIQLTPQPSPNGLEVEYILQIGIDPAYFEQRIPTALKNGASVRFYPILFEVGVDIFQAASNLGSSVSRHVNTTACEPDAARDVISDDEDDDVGISDDDVLVQLNYEAFQKMNAYAQSVSPAAPVQATPQYQTHPLLATLIQHIVSSSGKMNHEILAEAAALAQKLSGGIVVFCKSGKDRTAMHVTYKQAQFATKFRQHNPDPRGNVDGSEGTVADTTLNDAMLIRLYGTRLPICEKNVGQAKYAFNSLQVKFMPDALKPPPSALAGFLKGGKVFGGGGIES
jgi:hypothetical protein